MFPIGPRLVRRRSPASRISSLTANFQPPLASFPLRSPDVSLVSEPIRAGLVTRLQESGVSASDFLASLELVIVENAGVIQMQNWQHVQTVFQRV